MYSAFSLSFFNYPYTVKNNRNFTDPVMGNCDKKSTGNREFKSDKKRKNETTCTSPYLHNNKGAGMMAGTTREPSNHLIFV